MLVAVILVVETGSRAVRVHHADLDHHGSSTWWDGRSQASGCGDPVRVWLRGQTRRDGGRLTREAPREGGRQAPLGGDYFRDALIWTRISPPGDRFVCTFA